MYKEREKVPYKVNKQYANTKKFNVGEKVVYTERKYPQNEWNPWVIESLLEDGRYHCRSVNGFLSKFAESELGKYGEDDE